MNKIINVILISFFSVLGININIGFSLYIPILFILTHKNFRNLILIIPLSLASIYIFYKQYFFTCAILLTLYCIYLFLIKKVFYKYDNLYTECGIILVLNIVCFMFLNNSFSKSELLMYFIFTIISIIIYSFFESNMMLGIKNKGNIYSYVNIEVVMFMITVFGATNIDLNINLPVLLAIYFIMYLSSSSFSYHSIFLSLVMALFFSLYIKVSYAFILPFISALYMLNGLWGSIILISICFITWLSKQSMINSLDLQLIIYTAIFFELVKGSVITYKTKEEDIYKDAYEKSVNYLNSELLTFATFLDIYSKDFLMKKEYNKKLGQAIETIKSSCCNHCYMKDTCYKSNKNLLYKYFSEIILFSKRSDYSEDTFIHLKKCPYISEMMNIGYELNKKYDITNMNNKSNALIGTINGISNVIRLYTVDNSLKREIDYNTVWKIKKSLCSYGFNICYFNPIKLLVNDFEIEVGLRGENYNDINESVEAICSNYILNGVSTIFKKSEKGKAYFNIVPRIKYSIDFGYCNFSSSENDISGDNCLIKDMGSVKSIAVICDGMGKGYEANDLSYSTIKLIERIIDSNISTNTSIQILNTFYYLQDYIEKYSTLDLVEINKLNGSASFYKLGAATTYLFHKNGRCSIVENRSLPFGVEEMVEGVELDVGDGDMIIMASDGVFDTTTKKEEIESYIKGIMHMPAQKIVYEISSFIKSNKRLDDDDMSIIAMKLSKI